jgi:hypothetical protein
MAKPLTIKTKKPEDVRSTVPVDEVTKVEPVRINLNIQPSVRNAWKMAGVQLGMTMTDMIEAAMTEYLKNRMNK